MYISDSHIFPSCDTNHNSAANCGSSECDEVSLDDLGHSNSCQCHLHTQKSND